MGDITKNFSASEFTCKCPCKVDGVKHELVHKLQQLVDEIEDAYGGRRVKCVITSGFRCAEHNRRVGGSKNSRHVKGDAADTKWYVLNDYDNWDRIEPIEVAQRADALFDGIGTYSTFTHLDTRGYKARWSG